MVTKPPPEVKHDIDTFISSIEGKEGGTGEKVGGKKIKSREKIITAIKGNGRHTTNSLAELVGVSPKAIEKHLAKLKAEGILVRIGPDKGGHWEVVDSERLENTESLINDFEDGCSICQLSK